MTFSTQLEEFDIDGNGFLLRELDQLSVQARRYFLTTYLQNRRMRHLYALFALVFGWMGLHLFYINMQLRGYIRLSLSLASLFFLILYTFSVAGAINEFFAAISGEQYEKAAMLAIGMVSKIDGAGVLRNISFLILVVVGLMNLNDVFNSEGELRRCNYGIASNIFKLIVSSDSQ